MCAVFVSILLHVVKKIEKNRSIILKEAFFKYLNTRQFYLLMYERESCFVFKNFHSWILAPSVNKAWRQNKNLHFETNKDWNYFIFFINWILLAKKCSRKTIKSKKCGWKKSLDTSHYQIFVTFFWIFFFNNTAFRLNCNYDNDLLMLISTTDLIEKKLYSNIHI